MIRFFKYPYGPYVFEDLSLGDLLTPVSKRVSIKKIVTKIVFKI